MKSKSRIVSVLTGLLIFTLMPLNGANGTDYTPAIISEIAGAQTLLVYPSDIAVAPNGDVWWSDWDSDKIFLFDKDATGDTAPKKIISMKRPDNSGDVSAIAVDAAGFLYASDAQSENSAFVRVFNPNVNDSQTIDNAVRTVSLARDARGIAVDAAGYIYVAHEVSGSDNNLTVSIYEPGVTNSASPNPVRSFTDNGVTVNDGIYGFAVNPSGEIIIGKPQSDSIRIYANNSTGTPLRTISGDQTQLSALCGYWRVRIDSIGRIYVGGTDCSGNKKILVFESSANGNVAPGSVVLRTLNGRDLPFALSGNSNIWFVSEAKIRKIANPLSFPLPPAAPTEAEVKAAAAVAAVKREAEVKTARADISKTLEKADNLTADAFAKADIAGVTTENIAQVQAEILALPAELRTDINQVLKVARKYEVVGKIASEQATTLPISAFVEVGLIPADSKNKVALIAAIRRASVDTRDSFADIQAVIAAEAARIQDRKDRLAATLARLKSK